MPRGPIGEKRPTDVIGAAVMLGRIATGEIEDANNEKNPHASALGRLGGAKGGKARADSLGPNNCCTETKAAFSYIGILPTAAQGAAKRWPLGAGPISVGGGRRHDETTCHAKFPEQARHVELIRPSLT
jgi:hypothetical protein